MATCKSIYLGELRTKAIHIQSGTEIITDAPIDNMGKGEAFSPTDLVATALGTCMMTTMGIIAQRESLELKGMNIEITKIMTKTPPRKIDSIIVAFDFNGIELNQDQKIKLKNAALHCPVSLSLDPAIKQVVDFGF